MKETAIKDPPNICPFCGDKRAGIQEGLIVFLCGTTIQYPEQTKKRSQECQRHNCQNLKKIG
jgi:hypothetical protein